VRGRDTLAATISDIKKLRAGIDGVNPCEPITLREIAALLRFPFVAASGVSSGVGALALVMTCIGLYGVVAFAVVQRTREIGIRMALGATPLSVLRSIVAGSVLRVALGIALGIPVCFAFSKIAASALYVVETFDTVAFAATPLLLAVVALGAAYVPARRAIRIDPIAALRQDWTDSGRAGTFRSRLLPSYGIPLADEPVDVALVDQRNAGVHEARNRREGVL